MSDLRKAAADALKAMNLVLSVSNKVGEIRAFETAKDNLKIALAEDESEPYGYSCMWPMSGGDSPDYIEETIITLATDDGRSDFAGAIERSYPLIPLYTHPARKLSVSEIMDCAMAAGSDLVDGCHDASLIRFARKVRNAT